MSVFPRRPRAISLLVAAAAGLSLVGLTASPASAATAANYGYIYYNAAVGEINDLTISHDGSDIILTEATVTITPSQGCAQNGSPNSVRCSGVGVNNMYIFLNDMDDTATVNSPADVSVDGGLGNDTLTTSTGNDSLTGGDGNDTLSGGAGNDGLNPGLGKDDVLGGAGLDRVSYPRGGDVKVSLNGAADDGETGEFDDVGVDVEHISTGSGNDTLIGSAVRNVLSGNGGNDTIAGGAGNDTLLGSDGRDKLSGGDGSDYLDGGSWEEAGAPRADVISGGKGTDHLGLYREANLKISLNDKADDGETGEGDNVKSDVEDISTGSGNDVILGSAAANEIYSGDGNDTVNAGGGSDGINGGRANDTLNGGTGVDGIIGDAGADTITSQDKHADEVNCGSSVDSVNRDGLDDVSVTCEQLT